MSLTIRQVPSGRGASWVREGFRTLFKRPLGFVGLYVLAFMAWLVLTLLPLVGVTLASATMPLVSIGYMLATRSALQGGPVHPGFFFEPLAKASLPARRQMVLLCVLNAAAVMAALALGDWADGGSFAQLQELLAASSDGNIEEMAGQIDSSSVAIGLLVRIGMLALVSVPFWHAPALVYWGGQSAAQALFSSTLAVWRNRGAFLVYGLAWTGAFVGLAFGMALLGVIFGVAGAQQAVGLAAGPIALVFSAAFYVSLLFTFDDSFGPSAYPGDAAAGDGPTIVQ
jgi:hypothetical protein